MVRLETLDRALIQRKKIGRALFDVLPAHAWGQNFNEQKNGPTHHGAHWLTNHACRNHWKITTRGYRTYEPFLSIFQRKQHVFRKGRGKVWVPCVVRKSLFRFFSFQEAKVHIIRLTTLIWLSFNKNSILVSRKKMSYLPSALAVAAPWAKLNVISRTSVPRQRCWRPSEPEDTDYIDLRNRSPSWKKG
jgi:hypothetical protein